MLALKRPPLRDHDGPGIEIWDRKNKYWVRSPMKLGPPPPNSKANSIVGRVWGVGGGGGGVEQVLASPLLPENDADHSTASG